LSRMENQGILADKKQRKLERVSFLGQREFREEQPAKHSESEPVIDPCVQFAIKVLAQAALNSEDDKVKSNFVSLVKGFSGQPTRTSPVSVSASKSPHSMFAVSSSSAVDSSKG